ncbi:hypothetical protein AAG906_032202 [Vitis piasezkii]
MQSLINRANVYMVYRNISTHRTFQSSSDTYAKAIDMYARDRALYRGRALHAHLVIIGLARLTYFAAKLMSFYTECGQLSNARKLFDKIPNTNIRRWIVLTGACARRGFYEEALSAFSEMQKEGLRPNQFVLPSILKACGHLSDRRTGENMHTVILKNSFESDAYIISALIYMYSKCGHVEKACRVFDWIVDKDLVVTNAMVSGYAQHGFVHEALDLVQKMQQAGVKPNVVSWNTLIAGFSQVGDKSMVSEVFRLMTANGVEPDVVSWTSVISGFVQNFHNHEGFDAFKEMLDQGFCPSSVTISSLLPACTNVANLRRGKEIHGYAMVIGVEKDVYVRSALVDMYAKCGYISEAKILFYMMPERNTVTWNSLIFGYANHGYCKEAIELFNQMEESDTKLDHLTFTAVLNACSHAGMVELGESLFQKMQEKYRIEPRLEHYACMVDLLGRAGKLSEAYDLIKAMPVEPDKFVWGALLGACRNHGNIELAEVAAEHLFELEPESPGSSLLLSNLYADAGRWGNAAKMKKMMKQRKFGKFQGAVG